MLPASEIARSQTIRPDQSSAVSQPELAQGGTPPPMFPNSEAVPHKRRDPREINDFVFATGLLCNAHGISRKQYESLRQILRLLRPDVSKLDALPETVGTLKKHVRQTLPLLEVRREAIALNHEKLSTQRQAGAVEREGFDPNIAPTKNLYFLT